MNWIGFDLTSLLLALFFFSISFSISLVPFQQTNEQFEFKVWLNVLGIHWIPIWRCFNNPCVVNLNYSQCTENTETIDNTIRKGPNQIAFFFCVLDCCCCSVGELRAQNISAICTVLPYLLLLKTWKTRFSAKVLRAIPVYNSTVFDVIKWVKKKKTRSRVLFFVVFVWSLNFRVCGVIGIHKS